MECEYFSILFSIWNANISNATLIEIPIANVLDYEMAKKKEKHRPEIRLEAHTEHIQH